MKQILLVICMLTGMLLSPALSAQEPVISFDRSRMSLADALSAIEQQSGYSIAYNENLLDLRKTVPTPSGKKLSEILSVVLNGTGTEAEIQGKIILIVRKEAPKQKQVRGTVVDKAGPVVGVVVQVEGTQNAASTDEEGTFTLPAGQGDVLLVTMLGYKDSRLRIGNRLEGIVIELTDDITLLEESVVVGYGSMQRRDITSAIATYKPAEEGERQVLSPDALLQGRVAGVNVSAASGTPGGKSRVSIRGIGSLTAGNEPLYVIDGIPISNTSGDAGAWNGESLSGLSDMNPADIESIQVLKDAASAAIYGSRATNALSSSRQKKERRARRSSLPTPLSALVTCPIWIN